jgi:hypothetical protein
MDNAPAFAEASPNTGGVFFNFAYTFVILWVIVAIVSGTIIDNLGNLRGTSRYVLACVRPHAPVRVRGPGPVAPLVWPCGSECCVFARCSNGPPLFFSCVPSARALKRRKECTPSSPPLPCPGCPLGAGSHAFLLLV